MKRTISDYEFVKEFDEMNRSENFSRAARFALFDYLEEYEQETGEEMELDVIALCCDYSEYESIEEFNRDYGKECENLDDIREYTEVIQIEDTDGTIEDRFIIQRF